MDVSREAQRTWPTTPTGKLVCPECGKSGYYGGKWVLKHEDHVTCTCGQRVTRRGLGPHQASMKRHGRPCS